MQRYSDALPFDPPPAGRPAMLTEFFDFMKKYWWVSVLIIVAFGATLTWFAAQEGARPESPFAYRMD